MKTRTLRFILLAVPLLVTVTLLAQGLPTGTISGRAINENLGLPGRRRDGEVSGLAGTRTAVTSINGDYALPNLAPGDYTLTFTMTSFQTVTRNLKVNASQSAVINVNMQLSAVAAEVTVVSTSESISQTASAATTVTSDLTKKLPVTRTLLSAVALSPGVNANGPGGATTISGAESYDNLVTINGVVTQDNIRGSPQNLFIEDAIQETTTSTAAISAEYGRFTGGVINAITKSGGNAFSGSFRATLNNDSWQATKPLQTVDYTDKTIPTYEATLGGPIWKDRIWFFAAGRSRETDATAQTYLTNVGYPSTTEEMRLEGKLTITPFQNHTVTASYIDIANDATNVNPGYSPMETKVLYNPSYPQSLLALNYNGVLTNQVFVEAQYSQRKFAFEDAGGSSRDLIAGTNMIDATLGGLYNASPFCAVCDPETRDNENFLAKGTLFLSTKSLGSHNIVFGYDNFNNKVFSNNYQSGSNYTVYSSSTIVQGQDVYPVVGSDAVLVYWPIFELSKGSNVRTHSFYVNDTWRLNNNLSFNVGLRYDKNDGKDSRGVTTSDDSAFSPRLAATWDVKGDGRLRVGASYARYVGGQQENFIGGASAAGSPEIWVWYYEGDPINEGDPANPVTTAATLEQMFRWFGITGINQFPTRPGIFPIQATVAGVSTQIRESLKSTYTDEFGLSVAGSLGTRGNFRLDGIYRKFGNFIDTLTDTSTGKVTDSVGITYDLALLQNTNAVERTYAALQAQAAYRFFDSLNLGGNYTYAHTYGNAVTADANSGPRSFGWTSYPEYADPDWNIPIGSLPQDQRHRLVAYAVYDLPLPKVLGALNFSVLHTWNSGTPYGAVGSVATQPYVADAGYETPPASVSYYFTKRDAFRRPNTNSTDLSLNYSYFFGPVEIFVQPQVTNVFDNEAVIAVNTTVETRVTRRNDYLAFDPFTQTPTQGARGTGANWNYGPNFGKPTSSASFQAPRLFRIGLGVRF
ncbi:MAG: TonB-dependent receptor [Holophagales bacterium]|nr:TonB-dependent receptor [Holophagales bacterium]